MSKSNEKHSGGVRVKRVGASSDLRQGQTLQTLERGLHAMTFISQHENGVSIAELSAHLAIDRAIGYRLAATLESNGFVVRGADGQLHLGAEVLSLAARFEPQLRALATPLVQDLAQRTKAAAFISVPEGDTCVAIMVAEPDAQLLRLSYRVGSRHPLSVSAAGIAILAGRPEEANDSDAVRQARRLGYSVTRDQFQRGAVGVATAIHGKRARPGFEGSVGVVAMDGLDVEHVAAAVKTCARRIAEAINSRPKLDRA